MQCNLEEHWNKDKEKSLSSKMNEATKGPKTTAPKEDKEWRRKQSKVDK